MKKPSKILAIVLTLCVLCGILALSIGATEETTPSVPSTQNTIKLNDHDKTVTETYDSDTSEGLDSGLTWVKKSFVTINGNKVLNLSRQKISGTAAKGYYEFNTGYTPWSDGSNVNPYFIQKYSGKVPGQTNMTGTQVSAITVDFDFGSDKWSYQDEAGKYYLADSLDEIPANARNVSVALNGINNFCGIFRIPVIDLETGEDSSGGGDYHYIYLVSKNGQWYFSSSSAGTTNDILASNQPGILDHITYLVYPGNNDYTAISEVYINGKYLGSKTITGNSTKFVYFDAIRLDYTADDYGKEFSEIYDNFAVNYFAVSGDNSSTEIDAIVAARKAGTTVNLYEKTGVVYTSNYNQLGAGTVKINDTTYTNVALRNNALSAVADGDIIEITETAVRNFTPAITVNSFTVKLGANAEFALAASQKSEFSCYDDNGTLTYTRIIRGDALIGYADFDDIAVGKSAGDAIPGLKLQGQSGYGKNGNYGKVFSGKVANEFNGVENNNYLNFKRLTNSEGNFVTSTDPTTAFFEFQLSDYSTTKTQTPYEYPYFVTEFDFGCSEYRYTFNGETKTGTTVPEGATDVTLNYPNSIGIGYIVRASSGMTWMTWSLTNDGTDWYISQGSYKIKLSDAAGAWNNITLVTVTDTEKPSNSRTHAFVNGQYLNALSFTSSTSTSTTLGFDAIRFTLPTAVITDDIDFSFMVDNIANYGFEARYSSGESVYGLDDYFTDKNYTQRLDKCDDVTFGKLNSNSYMQLDGGEKYHYSTLHNNVISNITSGSEVTLSREYIKNFTPANGVTSFNVTLLNGAMFTLSPEAAANYACKVSGNVLTCELATEDEKVTVEWKDYYGNTIATSTTALGSVPTKSITAPTTIDFATGKEIAFDGLWKWTPDGDGEIFRTTLTAEMISEIKANGGTVSMIPVMSESGKSYAFSIAYDYNGETYIPANCTLSNFASLTKTNLNLVYKNAADGSVIRWYGTADALTKLPSDGGFMTLNIPNKAITVDLNGNTFLRATANQVFTISAENVTLTVCNGSIISGRKNSATNAETGVTTVTLYDESGLIGTTTINKATINLGSPDGTKPFNFYGGTVYYSKIYKNEADGTADDGKLEGKEIIDQVGRVTLNVNGGTYYSGLRPAYGLFAVLAPDVSINVKNATLFCNSANYDAYGIFGDYTGQTTVIPSSRMTAIGRTEPSNQIINCYDSVIISQTPAGAKANIFYHNLKGISAYFEGCTINGLLRDSSGNNSSVVLGPNNRVAIENSSMFSAYGTSGKTYTLGQNVAVINSNGNFIDKITITYPVDYIMNNKAIPDDFGTVTSDLYVMSDVEFTLATNFITYDTTNSKLVDIIFSTDGEKTDGTYKWLAGSILVNANAIVPEITPEELNNGWYDLGYAEWVSANESYVVVDGLMLTPTKRVPVASIDGVKLNMSLWAHHGINLYIPKPSTDSGVIWNGFYEYRSDVYTKITSNGGSKTIDGVLYYFDTVFPTVTTFTNYTRYADITVVVDGESYTINQKFTYNVLDYVNRVLNAYGASRCGSDDLKLIYEIVRYKDVVANYAGTVSETTRNAIDAVYAKFDAHGASCTCKSDLADIQFSDAENAITSNSYSELSAVLHGVSFRLTDKPVLSVYLKTLAEGQTASISITSKDATTGDTYKYGGGVGKAISDKFNDTACSRYDCGSIYAYNINTILTIRVTITSTDAETGNPVETVYSGQYCLAEYIENCADANAKLAAQSFWSYSNAALQYKILRADEQ